MSWTDERIDRLKVLWTEGLSLTQIAAELGGSMSRNAVMGKVHRLKLPGRRGPVARTAPRSRRAIIRARNAGEMTTAVKLGKARMAGARSLDEALLQIKPTGKIIAGLAWEALPDTTPIPLLMLSDATCRWPVGDPLLAGFGFCGCPVEPGRVYCPTHRALGTTEFKATAEDKRKLEKTDTSRRVFA